MSYWGQVQTIDGRVHIVPCTENGKLLGQHILCTICPCKPYPDMDDVRFIIHHDLERGGNHFREICH